MGQVWEVFCFQCFQTERLSLVGYNENNVLNNNNKIIGVTTSIIIIHGDDGIKKEYTHVFLLFVCCFLFIDVVFATH